MFDMLSRLTKFSIHLLTKIVELPFHLLEFGFLVGNAAVIGAMGGGVVYVVCLWLQLDAYRVALPWAIGLGVMKLARNVHAVYVRGECIE